MNQLPIKNAVQRIVPPQLPPKPAAAPKTLTKAGPLERVERFLKGKYFHCLYHNATRFRAGQFIEVIDNSWCLVRYFSLRDGSLQPWEHLIRLFGEETSVETLNGFWVHQTEADLDAAYRDFLQKHLDERSLAAQSENKPVSNEKDG